MRARLLFCLSIGMGLAPALMAATPPSPPAAVAAPTPFISTATIDDSLEITGETLATQRQRTRMTVGVMVDGKGPFQFLVDSGADRTVIGAALAKRLDLPAEDRVILHSMAGTSQVDTVRIEQLGLGRSKLSDIIAPALPEPYLGAQGILGIDALAEQRIEFDFDRKAITVQDTRTPIRGAADEIIVTARLRHGQLILTQVKARNIGLYAIIDSGSDITVGNIALRDRLFRHWDRAKVTKIALLSVTGETFDADMVTIPELQVGGLTLTDLQVAFADPPPFQLFGLAKQPAILLGTDVLQVFQRVSLDFRARKVRFRLRNRPTGISITR